jgi:hypothetical protein
MVWLQSANKAKIHWETEIRISFYFSVTLAWFFRCFQNFISSVWSENTGKILTKWRILEVENFPACMDCMLPLHLFFLTFSLFTNFYLYDGYNGTNRHIYRKAWNGMQVGLYFIKIIGPMCQR